MNQKPKKKHLLLTDEELEEIEAEEKEEKGKEEEVKDSELKKEIVWLRKQEEETEKRIEERLKVQEPKGRINKEQKEKYKKDTKDFLLAIPVLIIGPFVLLFALILFVAIPGSDIIALILCLIAIASMIWAIYNKVPSH